MISVVIPTRNRAYTLKKVLDSYYNQELVDEIIIVDDGSIDDTKETVKSFSEKYPYIKTIYIKHSMRKGASAARITGYKNAKNEYILFGEDDVFLEKNYAKRLFEKFKQYKNAGIVSGRIIYKLYNETNEEALKRFQYGFENKKPFDMYQFGLNVNAYFEGDIELPMTHALFLTKKEFLEKFGYDPFYSRGNGYREESDYQINLFINGYKIICTNDTHCFHMSKKEVKKGGQRINRFKQFYWNIYFTNYFYNKYFDKIRKKLNIKYGKNIAIILFSISMFNMLFIKPIKKIPMILWRRLFK